MMRFVCVFCFLCACLCAEEQFYSQASQDQFVYSVLHKLCNKQDQGYYVEIGASHPVDLNNSYFLEQKYNWKGISIDISDAHRVEWDKLRKNPLLVQDATQLNYQTLLRYFPRVIDYLSLDVDGYYDTVLKRLPFSEHIFKVITIEHDSYRFGNQYKTKEREILQAQGYHLLCSDVSMQGCSFEDWWIYPDAFPIEVLDRLYSLDLKGKDYREIIQQCNALHTP